MNKCRYCDYTYKYMSQFIDHLNAYHALCIVCHNAVVDNSMLDGQKAICNECQKDKINGKV